MITGDFMNIDTTSFEVERIRNVYFSRYKHVNLYRYTPFDPAHLLLHFSRQKALLNAFKKHGIYNLEGKQILDVGCGAGNILSEYIEYGADPKNIFGVDILDEDLKKANSRYPYFGLLCGNCQTLPFPDNYFDIVTQYTVFTSILNYEIKKCVASEMLRVLKPRGLIVFYDFWPNNPANPNVKGVNIQQVKSLFPSCNFYVQNIVLAPPIARLIAPWSTLLCQIFEKIPWLCSHYLVGISNSIT